MKKAAGSSARWIDVPGERFPGWIASFAVRHGATAPVGPDGEPEQSLTVSTGARSVGFAAPDGTVAECHPPFAESFAVAADVAGAAGAAAAIAAHAQVPRAVGVLLVRLGGYAAGVFTGYPPVLADAKVGSRLVHGRSAAGGWSQQRFARRREKQANEALGAAADTAVAVFGRWEAGITASSASAPGRPRGATGRGGVTAARSEDGKRGPGARGRRLDAVVLGGDKRAVAELRGDPRLAPYLVLATERFLTVPDPKRAVLEGTPRLFTAVRIRLVSPGGTTPRTPRCPPTQA